MSSEKARHMSAGPRAAATCLLFKYLYFFLCDERLLPEKTLLKVGPDVVSRSHGLFPAWVKHFSSSLHKILRAPVMRCYPCVCQPCLQRAVGLGAGCPVWWVPAAMPPTGWGVVGVCSAPAGWRWTPFPLFSCWTESNLAILLAWGWQNVLVPVKLTPGI